MRAKISISSSFFNRMSWVFSQNIGQLQFSFDEEQFIYGRETSKLFFGASLVSCDEDLFHIEKNSVIMILHRKLDHLLSLKITSFLFFFRNTQEIQSYTGTYIRILTIFLDKQKKDTLGCRTISMSNKRLQQFTHIEKKVRCFTVYKCAAASKSNTLVRLILYKNRSSFDRGTL